MSVDYTQRGDDYQLGWCVLFNQRIQSDKRGKSSRVDPSSFVCRVLVEWGECKELMSFVAPHCNICFSVFRSKPMQQ